MYKYRYSSKKNKQVQQYLPKYCPRCGKKLVERTNNSTQEKFVGCSGFPKCKYIEYKTVVDYACETLGVTWRPNIDNDVISLLEKKCQSRDEREYLIGVAYYLDHHCNDYNGKGINLSKVKVEYKCRIFDGIGFIEPFVYWGGDESPSAMSFVPQLPFGEKYHHDFGIFYAPEHSFTPQDWWLAIAVEIDIHPSHEMHPDEDHYRDSLVDYIVLRINQEDKPLTWFKKVRSIWFADMNGKLEG